MIGFGNRFSFDPRARLLDDVQGAAKLDPTDMSKIAVPILEKNRTLAVVSGLYWAELRQRLAFGFPQ